MLFICLSCIRPLTAVSVCEWELLKTFLRWKVKVICTFVNTVVAEACMLTVWLLRLTCSKYCSLWSTAVIFPQELEIISVGCVLFSWSMAQQGDLLYTVSRKETKMFFVILLQNAWDADEIWYTVSWMNLLQNNINFVVVEFQGLWHWKWRNKLHNQW